MSERVRTMSASPPQSLTPSYFSPSLHIFLPSLERRPGPPPPLHPRTKRRLLGRTQGAGLGLPQLGMFLPPSLPPFLPPSLTPSLPPSLSFSCSPLVISDDVSSLPSHHH